MKSRTQLSDFAFTFHFHTLEKEMATHSSVLAWRIPGTAEPGGLPSMGSHRVGHNWSNLAAAWRILKSYVPLIQVFLYNLLYKNVYIYIHIYTIVYRHTYINIYLYKCVYIYNLYNYTIHIYTQLYTVFIAWKCQK